MADKKLTNEEIARKFAKEIRNHVMTRDFVKWPTLDGLIAIIDPVLRAKDEAADELRAENERLTVILEGKLDAETLLRYLNASEGAINMGVSPPEFVRYILAEMFAIVLDGAPNFTTAELTMRAKKYEMTIRRVEGETPGEQLNKLRSELVEARDKAFNEALTIVENTATREEIIAALTTAKAGANRQTHLGRSESDERTIPIASGHSEAQP